MNVLTWQTPPVKHAPSEYRIYRASDLIQPIGIVSGFQYKFKDTDIKKGQTHVYYIVSVDFRGDTSEPVSVVVDPKKKAKKKICSISSP